MPMLNFSDPRFWLDALQSVVLVILWLRRPGQDALKSAESLERRLALVEERMTHLPTDEEVTGLRLAVRGIEAQNVGQTQQLTALQSAVARIENYLLTKK